MVLKRRISYQWQLFIPLVTTLWIFIAFIGIWQYNREREYRKTEIDRQLDLVTNRILAAYDSDTDPTQFVDFVCRYYRNNPLYDLLRVSVYKDGELNRAWGEPIGVVDGERALGHGITLSSEADKMPETANRFFYYKSLWSDDHRVAVYSALPFDSDILLASMPSNKVLWVMFFIGLIMTGLAYVSTRYFGRNIRNLRVIANRAAVDPNFIPAMNIPHDELGDITRQIIYMYNERSKAMEQQRREHNVAMHAIEEKSAAKRQMTNNINHELRTPIGVVKGYIDTILDNPDMDESSRTHFLRKASEHVDRMVNLISDVSAITRLEDGKELISTEELDFHDLVFTLANDLEESGTMGKMTFQFDIPLDCKVHGNYNLLSGMILNLCRNSAAYSKGTMCEFKMTGEDKDYYYFEFRDNGTGVSEEHIPHLFDRFYRIDSGRSRKSGGTGLGLPIVQNTVLAHGGTITVENGELGGLSFKFYLPKKRRPK